MLVQPFQGRKTRAVAAPQPTAQGLCHSGQTGHQGSTGDMAATASWRKQRVS